MQRPVPVAGQEAAARPDRSAGVIARQSHAGSDAVGAGAAEPRAALQRAAAEDTATGGGAREGEPRSCRTEENYYSYFKTWLVVAGGTEARRPRVEAGAAGTGVRASQTQASAGGQGQYEGHRKSQDFTDVISDTK